MSNNKSKGTPGKQTNLFSFFNKVTTKPSDLPILSPTQLSNTSSQTNNPSQEKSQDKGYIILVSY